MVDDTRPFLLRVYSKIFGFRARSRVVGYVVRHTSKGLTIVLRVRVHPLASLLVLHVAVTHQAGADWGR